LGAGQKQRLQVWLVIFARRLGDDSALDGAQRQKIMDAVTSIQSQFSLRPQESVRHQ
jgi:hypothetical protein